ncbi:PIN domain-containing protein [Lysobacter sp. A3-1-A15]|uniref:PIN domain-containing protein n=1 Tax=Novilysobacter viscosus TaxID=3098602 RepID=UPI002ED86ECC
MHRLVIDDPRPRVVLDTNAWLDLLHYRDPRAHGLARALSTGALVAVTDAHCHGEWRRVLGYRQLKLDDASRNTLEAAHDRLAHHWPGTTPAPAGPRPALPCCDDPDDQKFIELAATCGAKWLVSRDLAVLAVGKRTAQAGLFWTLTPEQWGVAHAG